MEKDDVAKVGETVLIPWSDHRFVVMGLIKGKAVFNRKDYAWFEYFSDDLLVEGDEVHEVWMVR